MAYRADRVAQELQQEISQIIAREVRDPRVGFATVTGAKVSPDLRYARVYVSVLGTPEDQQATLDALNRAAGFMRRLVSARLRLRHTPELVFAYDQSVATGAHLEGILAEIRKETPDSDAPEEANAPPVDDA
jgi:ribosome-binding factor A